MTQANLIATGKCFDDAIGYFEYMWNKDFVGFSRESWRYKLVHAILSSRLGLYSHAWVERDDIHINCYFLNDTKVYVEMTAEEFKKHYKLIECTKYDIHEFQRLNRLHGTFGPWEDKYKSLTKDKKA